MTRTGMLRGARALAARALPLALVAAAAATTTTAVSAAATVAGVVRVDQVGFLASETKQAYLMATGPVRGATFSIVNARGATVLTGQVGATSRGVWNKAYPDVYPIVFSSVRTPGSYSVVVHGAVAATSPTFVVEAAAALYGKLVADGVAFFQTQRDGRNVLPGALHRRPAHLNDTRAGVYATPSFEPDGSDTITDSDLTRIGGPVNVEGGWFDAGDYLKFTHTAAYGDIVLFAAQRALGAAAPTSLATEAEFGESWLDKMWDQSTKTLYLQVGIGSGNTAGTFTGDHDLWRLPQTDDADTARVDRYAARHRPVFRAAAPGAKVSPNLVGRVSAAFALAAQVDAVRQPARAAAEYEAATSLYAMADTATPPHPLVTAVPNDYYPESTWHDDMELGASEIALAAQELGKNASRYVAEAARWARDYLATDASGQDTFNLYDVSALAHADLIAAITRAGNRGALAVTTVALVNDIRRQVRIGAARARTDVFHAGGVYTDFDVDAHTFGFLTSEALYERVSGDTSFVRFATEQRDWLFGANPWGTSFMVGEGTTYPHCMQHQVANLSGSIDGTPPIAVGAVVNGPNSADQFSDGLGDYQDGMVICPAGGVDPFAAFSGHGSRYVDDVRSWQSSEPALDMTGSAILGTALQEVVRQAGPA